MKAKRPTQAIGYQSLRKAIRCYLDDDKSVSIPLDTFFDEKSLRRKRKGFTSTMPEGTVILDPRAMVSFIDDSSLWWDEFGIKKLLLAADQHLVELKRTNAGLKGLI